MLYIENGIVAPSREQVDLSWEATRLKRSRPRYRCLDLGTIAELADLVHHGHRHVVASCDFALESLLLLLQLLHSLLVGQHLETQSLILCLNLVVHDRGLALAFSCATAAGHAGAVIAVFVGLLGISTWWRQRAARVDTAQMLVEVLKAGETLAVVTLAVDVRTVERILGSAVLAMDFALVTEQATRVGKPGEFLTSLGRAFVRPVVLVHVLTPLAFPRKLLDFVSATSSSAEVFAIARLLNLAIRLRDRFQARRSRRTARASSGLPRTRMGQAFLR